MKNTIIVTLIGMILLASFVKADQVNMDISVNGTANLNITIDADDTEARQAIAETQQDIYGTTTGSGPKDMVLEEIKESGGNPITSTEGLDTVDEICNDPYLQNYLKQMGTYPPEEFVEYVKGLGYDDESHITLVWSICQDKYIQENEGKWSADTDFSFNSLSYTIHRAMDWLLGKNTDPSKDEIEVAQSIDSYCASDKDVNYLMRRVSDLQLRVEALEITIEKMNSTEYCQSKIEILEKYDLAAVKCGETTYHNHLVSPITGESMILGITPANEETQTTTTTIQQTENNEPSIDENVLMSGQSINTNGQSTQNNINKVIMSGLSLQVPKPIEDFIMNAAVLMSAFTITTAFLGLGWSSLKGHNLFRAGTKKRTSYLKTKTRRSLKRNKNIHRIKRR